MRWATTEKTGRFRRFVGIFVWFWGSESSRISQSLRDTRYFCVMYFEERVKWAISSYLGAMKKSSSCLTSIETKCLNISWQGFAHRFSGAKSRSNSVVGKHGFNAGFVSVYSSKRDLYVMKSSIYALVEDFLYSSCGLER